MDQAQLTKRKIFEWTKNGVKEKVQGQLGPSFTAAIENRTCAMASIDAAE